MAISQKEEVLTELARARPPALEWELLRPPAQAAPTPAITGSGRQIWLLPWHLGLGGGQGWGPGSGLGSGRAQMEVSLQKHTQPWPQTGLPFAMRQTTDTKEAGVAHA